EGGRADGPEGDVEGADAARSGGGRLDGSPGHARRARICLHLPSSPDGPIPRRGAALIASERTPMSSDELPRFDVKGQVALVTGAARGIGRACALALARSGADVALGLRDAKTGGDLAPQIEGMGRRALRLQMDMTRLDEVQAAVEAAVAYFGRLDILVNNAGVAPENAAENVREKDFDLTLAVNLKGTFFASQAAGRVMIRQKYGRIVNLGSQAGFVALPT